MTAPRHDHRDDGCPNAEELFAFAVGRLPADARDAIANHIEACAACVGYLNQLDGRADPWTAALRPPVPADLFAPAVPTPGPGSVESGPAARVGTGQPPPASAGADMATWPVVPGYEVVEELGHGGMGVVYRAFDPDLQRRLVVKVLREDHKGRSDLEHRFLEEAQLTAQLQHPGIAPVHEVGRLADGRPFFAMKLIQGRTLAERLRARRDVTDGRTAWLAVFAQVCQAVAYAHSRGVLHRDLKPSNIMVGAFGEVQVMDWGLAKVLRPGGASRVSAAGPEPATIATVRTQAAGWSSQMGSVLGTAAFIAPEQAEGDVEQLDERCDVFGLGGILCVILTGAPPYEGPGEELLGRARRAELADAYTRLDGCGADAELVALAKACLAREKADRPRDAGAVAEAMAAYQAEVAERLRRGALERAAAAVRAGEERKRRRVLGAAVLVVVLGAGGVGGWFVQERAQTRAGVAALLEQAREHQEHYRWAEARAALTQAASRLGGHASADLAGAVQRAQADLDLVARLDAIRLERATWVEGHFNYGQADRDYEAAFREGGLGEVHDDPEEVAARVQASAVREALVAALDDWALCVTGEERRGRLLEVARRADPDPWRDRVREPVAWGDRAALVELARTAPVAEQSVQLLAALGEQLQLTGGDTEVTEFLRRVQRAHPDDFWANFGLAYALVKREPEEAVGYYRAALALRPGAAAVYNNLGETLRAQGRLDDAIDHYQQALQINPKLAYAHNDLGLALAAKGRPDEAIDHYRQALQINPKLAGAHTNLGAALQANGQLDEAIDHHQQALNIDPKSAAAHNNLGIALKAKGRLDEAINHYHEALQIDPKFVLAHFNLGLALSANNRLDEAIDHYRQALQLDPKSAKAHNNLGLALSDKGRLDEAIDHYRQALQLDPKSAKAHNNLGNALQAKGQLDEAIDHYRQALQLDPKYAPAHSNLGNALSDKGRLDEAIDHYRQALQLDPKYAEAHNNLGNALQAKGRLDEAIDHYRQALHFDPKRAPAHNNLGLALKAKGRLDEAIDHYQQALQLDPKFAPTHNNLGIALADKGQLDEAIDHFQQAILLDPKNARAQTNLGLALKAKGRLDEAIDHYQQALQINPKLIQVHNNLCGALLAQARFREAQAAIRRYLDLVPQGGSQRARAARQLQRCERLLALEGRLPAVLQGQDQPADAPERLEFADLCTIRKEYAAAARFYTDAFTAKPSLADDLQAGHRYNAACVAALAGGGRGADAAALDEKEPSRWRQQALDWLRAELAAWTKKAQGPPPDRVAVRRTLDHWRVDADLAGVREPEALGRLPDAERQAWQQLWAEVDRLRELVGESQH
jgi:tetratricopeptide (TPR) repeat protein